MAATWCLARPGTAQRGAVCTAFKEQMAVCWRGLRRTALTAGILLGALCHAVAQPPGTAQAGGGWTPSSSAQSAANDTGRAIEQYREAVADSSPGELWEIRGEALWNEVRGPRQVSLERCDLGAGPGVVAGAYARLPRWFADVGQVMDLETRLLHCMVTLQGFARDRLLRETFGDGPRRSAFEALSAWIAAQSRGLAINPPLAHPAEQTAYRVGRELFYQRGGTHDFSCSSCHGETGRRIRLQDLPNLSEPAQARPVYASWPAYRVSQGEMRTLQWRLNDCFRQQRFPQLIFGSPASIALMSYLANNARGAEMNSPGVKR